jgi:predicted transcriptional regulator
VVSRELFLESRLQALADRLCDGALVRLMTTLLRSQHLAGKERRRLREIINDLAWRQSGKRRSH